MESAVNDNSATSDSQEESKFAGVVFHNIQEIYIPGKDIRCCYSVKTFVSTTANDWIGLYRVGWRSPKDYLCYEYSPVIEKGSELSSSSLTASLSTQNSVIFRGQKLPSEECEFYQFCYVTSSGEIRGASYPFQISFAKPGELECCEEEDESGDTLLIVKNRTALLEDSLEKAYDENAAMKASKEKAEAECLKYQDMILNLEENKSKVVAQLEKQKKMLDKAMSEKTEFEESYKECVEQLKTSRNALKIANEKADEVKQQLDNERLQHVQTSSEQQKFAEEKSQMLKSIAHKDSIIQSFLDTVEENSAKTAALESEIQKLKGENSALQEDYDNLVVWKVKTDDSLKKSEQANTVLQKSLAEQFEQVGLLQAENSMMKDELAATQKEMEDLSHSFGNKQSAMEQKYQKEFLHFESQIEMFSSQLDGREQELAATKEKLDEILTEVERERKTNQQQVQEYEDSILKLQEQLGQERAFNNSLSSASDRQVAELQEQLNTQLQKNSSALQQTEDHMQEIKRLEERLKLKEEQVERMQSEMEIQAQQLEASEQRENETLQSNALENDKPSEKSAAMQGSYFALKTAHGQLRKQYLQAKKDVENLWRQKTDLKRQLATVQSELPDTDLRFQLANLKKQVEDLRIRLNMGAEAYKAKFKECRKYENQLSKMQKDANGQAIPKSPSSVTEFEIRNLKQSLENEKTATAALRKSLENYKVDAHEAKEGLSKIKKENECLQRQVTKLEQDIGVCNEETQRRLIEDKELQSHIECLHSQLEAKCEALKVIEERCKTEAQKNEKVIASLIEKNENLQRAVEEEAQQKREVTAERDELEQKMKENIATIEELKEMASLVDSVAKQDETNSNQENASESAAGDQTTRGPALISSTAAVQNGHQCPVCYIFYPPNSPQCKFEEHVHSHFKD